MKKFNESDFYSEPAEVTLTLNPEMEKVFKHDLNLEIEMMQGIVEKLPNGQTRYKFEVIGDKAMMLAEMGLKMISQSHTKNLS